MGRTVRVNIAKPQRIKEGSIRPVWAEDDWYVTYIFTVKSEAKRLYLAFNQRIFLVRKVTETCWCYVRKGR